MLMFDHLLIDPLMADILTFLDRKSTGETNVVNDGSVPSRVPGSHDSEHELAHPNGMQLFLMLLITPLIFLL